MNYIYDIVLNFNKDYFEFYEWKKSDKIINVKKIPAFKVNSEVLNSFKYNEVVVDKEFLDKIFDLTLFYSKCNYKYMCLLSDTNETIGVMFNSSGELIKRSSLVIDEEDEVNEEVVSNNMLWIKLVKNDRKDIRCVSRIDRERKEFLYKFINNLGSENVLKYMYYDYFEVEEDNIDIIKNKLLLELDNKDADIRKLYDLVKVLKKIKN